MPTGIALSSDTLDLLRRNGFSDGDINRIQSVTPSVTPAHALAPNGPNQVAITEPRNMLAPPAPRYGNRMTPAQIYQLALQTGFSPQSARIFTAMTMQESGGDINAFNPNDPHGGSFGLTQINGAHPGAEAARGNPVVAMRMAYDISNGGTNFRPWGSFTSGAYQRYISQANQAAGMPEDTPLEGPPPPTYATAPSGFGTGLTTTGAPVVAGGSTVPSATFDGNLAAGGGVYTPNLIAPGPSAVSLPLPTMGGFATGGAAPRATDIAQAAATGAGGVTDIPDVNLGPPATDTTGAPVSEVGGPSGGPGGFQPPPEMPRGALALALAGAVLRGGLRLSPVAYDPFRVRNLGVGELSARAPGNALGMFSTLGLGAPPVVGTGVAGRAGVPRPSPMAAPASPFYQLIGMGCGGQAAGMEYAMMAAGR